MWEYCLDNIRNFSIVAHVDHGKSTIADRLIDITQCIEARSMQDQLLDSMDLEREKGITIKAHPLTMYHAIDGIMYEINFIDTPGHVDFSYEVSRSLAACEGALLVVDATQGVQAQTIANLNLARKHSLEIIPVINKIDLPTADPERIQHQIASLLNIDAKHAILASAKTGQGVEQILEEIIYTFPAPTISSDELSALVFDSQYDKYRGAMIYVRVMSGSLQSGDKVQFVMGQTIFEIKEVGFFAPSAVPAHSLRAGEVGYVLGNIKSTSDVLIGDTIAAQGSTIVPLPGFQKVLPSLFAGIYPTDSAKLELLTESIYKLQLNDSALQIEKENSSVLGLGFHVGFLGILHMEITLERLYREFDVEVITTIPNVSYHVHLKNGNTTMLCTPGAMPDPSIIEYIEEPWVKCQILIPESYIGLVMKIIESKRGKFDSMDYSMDQVIIHISMPLNEMIIDFGDAIKSATSGYGSFQYEHMGYFKSDIVKVDILVNEQKIEPLSMLTHCTNTLSVGKYICAKLKEFIPKEQFKIPIQAVIGGKIIARETISALSRNVAAKCYGGDISRKKKLWERQKKGKKAMREFGKVAIPQAAFVSIMKREK